MRRDYGINCGLASGRPRKTSPLWKLSGSLGERVRFRNDLNRYGAKLEALATSQAAARNIGRDCIHPKVAVGGLFVVLSPFCSAVRSRVGAPLTRVRRSEE